MSLPREETGNKAWAGGETQPPEYRLCSVGPSASNSMLWPPQEQEARAPVTHWQPSPPYLPAAGDPVTGPS